MRGVRETMNHAVVATAVFIGSGALSAAFVLARDMPNLRKGCDGKVFNIHCTFWDVGLFVFLCLLLSPLAVCLALWTVAADARPIAQIYEERAQKKREGSEVTP